MDWIQKKYWKKSLRYNWPWKSTVKVTFHFLHKRKLEMTFQCHWCAKNGKNSEKKSSKHLWPWKCLFRGEILVSSTNAVRFNLISEGYINYCGINAQHDLRSTTWTRNFFLFFTYSGHQTTYENLLKTRLILEMESDLKIEIFKVKGVCGNFFTILFIFSAWNYIEIPSQTLMTNEPFFTFHFTLPAGLVGILTSSQFGDSTWDIQWFYV